MSDALRCLSAECCVSVVHERQMQVKAYGVRTISAPSALNITSFSKLIFAGSVMIHLGDNS